VSTRRQTTRSRAGGRRSISLPVMAAAALVAVGVAVAVIALAASGTLGQSGAARVTPVATPAPGGGASPAAGPTEEPGFILEDRCVRAEFYPRGQEGRIAGGGLDLTLQVQSVTELTRASNEVVEAICGKTLTRNDVDTLVQRVGTMAGVAVKSYTWAGG